MAWEELGKSSVSLSGRKTLKQRVLVNQPLLAGGSAAYILNCGAGAESFNVRFKASGIATLEVYPCDQTGTLLGNGPALFTTSTVGKTTDGFIISDWGGAEYIGLYIVDKSATTNTVNFIDIDWTMGG